MKLFKRNKKKKVCFNPETAIVLLAEATEICRKNNLRTWLTDGTLLGYYREGGFISHDLDMDMGAFIEEYDQNLDSQFEKQGWQIIRKLGDKSRGLELTLGKEDHHLDIFFFYKDDDTYWNACWQGIKIHGKRFRRMIKYSYEEFSLKKIEFLDYSFNVPDDTEKYLITKYGNGWKTPQKDWDWALDPANAQVTDIIIPTKKKHWFL